MITTPSATWTQNPEIPIATIPVSRLPIITDPMKVPSIVPIPPKYDVPPRKTGAIVLKRKPDPSVGQ
jgi:hypothetical protein